jgi:hypothetical protein
MVLPRDLVPVCLLFHRGAPSIDARMAADAALLRDTGIVRDGSLSAPAARLIEPVASPDVLISVDVAESRGRRVFSVWRNSAGVTLGSAIGTEAFELRKLDVATIPFDLAAALELRIRQGRPTTPRFWDRSELAARSKPPGRRWRASTVWTSADGSVCDHSIEIVEDARSYWEITAMEGRSLFLATPRTIDDVLRILGDLDPLG